MQIKRVHIILLVCLLGQYLYDLTATIGTEIETDHDIVILYHPDGLLLLVPLNERHHKLVGNLLCICRLYTAYKIAGRCTGTFSQQIVSL
ncbi:hypothetical protein D3C87_1661980 [compost metagenome]